MGQALAKAYSTSITHRSFCSTYASCATRRVRDESSVAAMLGAMHVDDALNPVVDRIEMILVVVGVGGKVREEPYQHMQILNGTLHNCKL
jgi:hypothetical protein